MGAFTVPVQIGNPAGGQFIDITALVDTGSTYTALPTNTLTRLGVTQEGLRRLEMADNRIVEYPIGEVRMRLEGEEHTVLVVFAPEGTDALLGVTALEIFSLGVDPLNQRLIPVPALLK